MAVKKLESVPVEALIPYARNSRTHSDEQVAQIAASIREFGFNNPVLVGADNDIIAGHGRVLAARKLGFEAVPCLRLEHLTETQKRAYVIADNKLALNAGWDEELLKLELVSLRDEEAFDLALTGFSDAELESLLAVQNIEGETDPDEVPEPPAIPVNVLGDMWTLGNHRAICGDSTNVLVVEKLLNGTTWETLLFDPPYEIEELYSSAMLPFEEGKKLIVFWDFKRFAKANVEACNHGWPPQFELIWDNVTSWYTPNRPLARHKACGIYAADPYWDFDSAIISDGKKRAAKTVSNSRGQCEYTPLDGAVHLRTVEAFPTTSEKGGHAHSKPVKWIAAILNGIQSGNILDLFCGSGTTIIAAEMTGRSCFAVELSPAHLDVAIARWQDFTGKQAVHESGKTFDEMKSERQK